MRLAIIPARGGSKRIPRKNIKLFGGKPMIAWSIEAAMRSGCFDRIIVSTDDAEIADFAVALGAEAPFMRPAALSDDHTPTIPVIAHAIAWQQEHGETPSEACCIYATAPFITADDLQRGINDRERVEMFQPTHFNTRSQDLEEAFHDAGQFYWGKAQAWLENKPIFSSDSAPVMLPRHRVQDIDTPEDWQRAQWMFEIHRQHDI
jgi:N-acylneuraminate cytidylyltransferase